MYDSCALPWPAPGCCAECMRGLDALNWMLAGADFSSNRSNRAWLQITEGGADTFWPRVAPMALGPLPQLQERVQVGGMLPSSGVGGGGVCDCVCVCLVCVCLVCVCVCVCVCGGGGWPNLILEP